MDKIRGYMTAVAVENEKPVAAKLFLLCEALKYLFKPSQSCVIIYSCRG
jgi:hypothetical protein